MGGALGRAATPIFNTLLLATGAYLASVSARDLINAQGREDWPTVQGDVVQSYTVGTPGNDAFEIAFRYTVNGESYTSARIASGSLVYFSRESRVPDRYPEGSTQRIYYDPDAPWVAVFEPGIRGGTWWSLILGLVLIWLAVVGFKHNVTLVDLVRAARDSIQSYAAATIPVHSSGVGQGRNFSLRWTTTTHKANIIIFALSQLRKWLYL